MSWGRTVAHRLRKLWWRLRRPTTRGVRVILSDEQGRVCLVRHSYTTGWYLPGGGLRRGESPGAGAVRELAEELGVTVSLGRQVGIYANSAEGKQDTVWVFEGSTPDRAEPASGEVVACTWFHPAELPAETSPATRRRLAEWAGTATPTPVW